VLRASFWLAPCFPPRDLAISRWTRRAMRSTNFCHLNDIRAPVLRAFPARYAAFTAWTPPSFEGIARATRGVLGSVRLTGGPSVSRHSRTLRRIVARHALPIFASSSLSSVSGGGEPERGRFVPTAPATDLASDTSVASPPCAESWQSLRPVFERSHRALASCLCRFFRVRKPPRSP